MAFDRYVAIDWSGARKANGIAVALCDNGSGPPFLVPPLNGARGWSRGMVAAFISDLAGDERSGRSLVGIDCAFSLPVHVSTSAVWIGLDDAFSLWKLAESVALQSGCDAFQQDFYGGAFAKSDLYSHVFWHRGALGQRQPPAHRLTEHACKDQGLGHPESPLKMIGAKQVGKGGLAGMRMMHHLKSRYESQILVWPFDNCSQSSVGSRYTASVVLAEIYPRLFLRQAGCGSRKIRRLDDLQACLTNLGCDLGSNPCTAGSTVLSDHETDALVAAAGLRWAFRSGGGHPLAQDWMASLPAIEKEGWIFGVGRPDQERVFQPETKGHRL